MSFFRPDADSYKNLYDRMAGTERRQSEFPVDSLLDSARNTLPWVIAFFAGILFWIWISR